MMLQHMNNIHPTIPIEPKMLHERIKRPYEPDIELELLDQTEYEDDEAKLPGAQRQACRLIGVT